MCNLGGGETDIFAKIGKARNENTVKCAKCGLPKIASRQGGDSSRMKEASEDIDGARLVEHLSHANLR